MFDLNNATKEPHAVPSVITPSDTVTNEGRSEHFMSLSMEAENIARELKALTNLMTSTVYAYENIGQTSYATMEDISVYLEGQFVSLANRIENLSNTLHEDSHTI